MHTILLIDNSPLVRECLSTILRVKGYRVQCAATIAQARSTLSKRLPDVMVTEICLPDDNVLNLLRSMQGTPNLGKMKICLLTQAAAKKPIMEAIELGASKVMLKTQFTIASFLEQLQEALAPEQPQGGSKPGAPSAKGSDEPMPRYPLPAPAPDPLLGLKQVKPLMNRSQLNSFIDQLEEIGTVGTAVERLLELIDTPNVTFDQIAALVEVDQVLSTKVMREANSPTYAGTEQSSSIKDALLRIGLENLRPLIEATPTEADCELRHKESFSFDTRRLWAHAVGVGVCSARIASLCEEAVNPKLAYTTGLLHDMGRVILQQAMPQQYAQVMAKACELGVPLGAAEKRMLLTDHTTTIQSMMHSWNLPKDLVESIACHHEEAGKLGAACPKSPMLAATVALANRVVLAMGVGASGDAVIEPSEDLFTHFEDHELTIDKITEGLDREIKIKLDTLDLSPSGGGALASPWGPVAPVFDQPLRPAYLTMDPGTDLIGQWVMRQRDPSAEADEPCNLAVVHLRQPRDRQALGEQLIAAQVKANEKGAKGTMPVLMLSPSGRTSLIEELICHHPALHLMTPFSAQHFEQAANRLLNGSIAPDDAGVSQSMRQAA